MSSSSFELLIDVASVANHDNDDSELVVLDIVDNSIVSHSNTEEWEVPLCSIACGARIVLEVR